MFKGVLLDLDGTLVDSTEAHLISWKEALRLVGVKRGEDEIRRNLGRTTLDIAKALLLNDIGRVEECVKVKDDFFLKEGVKYVKLIAGAREALKAVKNMGLKCAVASSNPRKVIDKVLSSQGLAPYVDTVVSVEEIEYGKPNPEMLIKASQKLGLKPHECVAVGDSQYDVEAGNRAGMLTIAVLTGVADEVKLKEAGPKMIIRSIAELPKTLLSL